MSFLHFNGTNSSEEAGTVTVGSVSYTVYSKMSVACYGDEKTLKLSAGKYRQRIVGGTIYTLSGNQPVFTGLEQWVTYHCKAEMGKVEETGYEYDDDISVSGITPTLLGTTETADAIAVAVIGVNATIVLPMTNITNTDTKSIIYNYDTDGNVIGFTIPDGMAASMVMEFHNDDEGCLSFLTGTGNSGSGIDIIDEENSDAGNATYRIIDSDGNVVWSEYVNGQLGENKNCQSVFYLAEGGGETITLTLPAGTYRMECVFSDIEMYIGKGLAESAVFTYSMDFWIGVSLTVGYNRNTYGMNALTIPDISQTTILTIPEHTETVVDTDKTYDTILGLYIFGSYDGRKWALLGHREKNSDFRDIGALVERTDCRFFRFVLAGQVSKDSRFDYFEVSSRASKLNGKIR